MIEIKKVLLPKNGGLDVKYSQNDTEEKENSVDYKIRNVSEPHPDLKNIITSLAPIVAQCYGVQAEEKDLDRIKVKGVEYCAGNSVMIHFDFVAQNEAVVKLVTPRIKLEENVWGFEEYLAENVRMLADETEKYLGGKRAQLSIFDELVNNEE